MPPMSLVHPAFGTRATFYMPPTTLIPISDDMLSLTLGQHILDYEPPHRFVIPAFSTFDGSANPYGYNQAMILNVGNDHMLCKVFLASLRGPALAWFHKLSLNSINSFNELWGIRIIVSLFGEKKWEHQLLTDNSQVGRRVYSRLHKEVWASRPADRVV